MKMLAPEQKTRSLRARDDDGAHFGMLEADALERVVQLDVDAEVVRVELELVAGADAAVLGDVHRERRDRRRRRRAASGGSARDRFGSRRRSSRLLGGRSTACILVHSIEVALYCMNGRPSIGGRRVRGEHATRARCAMRRSSGRASCPPCRQRIGLGVERRCARRGSACRSSIASRIARHRPEVALRDDAAHVLVGRRLQPDGEAVREQQVERRGSDTMPPGVAMTALR